MFLYIIVCTCQSASLSFFMLTLQLLVVNTLVDKKKLLFMYFYLKVLLSLFIYLATCKEVDTLLTNFTYNTGNTHS